MSEVLKKIRTNVFLIAILGLFFNISSAVAQTPQAQMGQSDAPPPPAPPRAPKKPTPSKKTRPPVHKTVAKKKPAPAKKKDDEAAASAEPDKVLYDRALEDLKHSRYTEGRLALQTLINTYPDSEYLAKAKLAIADSYYKESGATNLTEAVNEYKDFITFFPFLDEAAYAQMQVGMAHYKMMEKPDRDQTEAENAESEFQTFLLKYPQSPLAPKAEQYLRDVQEILADGDFEVGRFYFLRGDYRAAGPRLYEVADRYPLYSQADKALWMLGGVYEKAEKRDMADKVYARIVREYPLSSVVEEAKQKLIDASVPVPQADPVALARMKKDRQLEQETHESLLTRLPMGMLRSRPDVSMASRAGKPNLEPPDTTISAADILKPGAAPVGTVTAQASTGSSAVETVSTGADSGTSMEQVESASPPENNPTSRGLPASGIPSAVTGSSGEVPAAETGNSSVPQAQTGGSAGEADPPTAAVSDSNATPTGAAQTGAASTNTSSTSAAHTSSASSTDSNSGSKTSSQQSQDATSTTKKKKGLKKIIPW